MVLAKRLQMWWLRCHGCSPRSRRTSSCLWCIKWRRVSPLVQPVRGMPVDFRCCLVILSYSSFLSTNTTGPRHASGFQMLPRHSSLTRPLWSEASKWLPVLPRHPLLLILSYSSCPRQASGFQVLSSHPLLLMYLHSKEFTCVRQLKLCILSYRSLCTSGWQVATWCDHL